MRRRERSMDCETRNPRARARTENKSGPRHTLCSLPLLPSGPGGIHERGVAWDHKLFAMERTGAQPRRCRPLAERVGFEPTVPFRGTHDFQSCTFGLSVISPGSSMVL